MVIKAESPVTVDRPQDLRGKRALVIEDGPTLTHGEMKFGAGVVAARREGATTIVDPRQYATGSLREVFEQYDVGPVLPAEGYSPQQLAEIEAAIISADADVVVIATPVDLRHLIRISKPTVRVTYGLREVSGSPTIGDALAPVIRGFQKAREVGIRR
ncbi:MAG TPA: GTPase, partial [Acidimicrobiia bacterium]